MRLLTESVSSSRYQRLVRKEEPIGMTNPNLVVLYVEDTKASAAFYERITGAVPNAAGPNFTALQFGGLMLGLWNKKAAFPPVEVEGTASEIGFMVKSADEIDALYARWQAAGIPIAQELVTRDFGPTFVALDPDGHRLRVCLFDA